MSGTDHKDREHARLSASGAYRWINSPGSVVQEELAEEIYGIKDESSEFADEGTKAHELSDIMLRNAIGELSNEDAERMAKKYRREDKSMVDYVGGYVDRCMELVDSERLKGNDPLVLIEAKVKYTNWVPEGFGTCDFIMISGNRLVVRDFKYGKGVPVSAVDNPQPRLYALGVIQEWGWIYDIDEIEMHIDQPRIKNITAEILSAKELLEWAEEVVRPAAEKAWKGEGGINPGPWDRFSKIKGVCKITANQKLSILNQIINKYKKEK